MHSLVRNRVLAFTLVHSTITGAGMGTWFARHKIDLLLTIATFVTLQPLAYGLTCLATRRRVIKMVGHLCDMIENKVRAIVCKEGTIGVALRGF